MPIEALACGAPVIALARGGVAETVDNFVGRTYNQPTSDGLLDAMNTWEAQGCPHDAIEARRRAEALSLPLFRERILKFLADVVPAGAPTRSPLPRI